MYDPDVHKRRSIRLRGFDYTGAGAYFMTVCAWRRECLFGDVVDGDVRLNEFGMAVREEWLLTPQIRTNVELDAFIVMPNHFHAILWITDDVGARRAVPGFDRAVPGFDRAVPGFDRAVPGFDRAPQTQGTARRAPTSAVVNSAGYKHPGMFNVMQGGDSCTIPTCTSAGRSDCGVLIIPAPERIL